MTDNFSLYTMTRFINIRQARRRGQLLCKSVSTSGSTKPHILLQQDCIPSYRKALFEKLCADQRVNITIVADDRSDAPFLRVLPLTTAATAHRVARVYSIRLPWVSSLSWQPQAITVMLRERPDIVVTQGSPYVLTAWALLLLGRLFGIPVLLWTHGLLGDDSGMKWIVRKSMYRLAAGLLLYGDHARKLLVEKGFPQDKLSVLYNSLDYDWQKSVAAAISEDDCSRYREALGVRSSERMVVFTGRLEPVKRLPLLVEAVAELAQRGHRVHLVLIGEGTERPALERQAGRLAVNNLIHFVGELYEERDVGLALSASDLAVIPSGAGLSVMHALAYGTPVLLHDRPDQHFPEWEAVVEGVTGFFYRCNDVKDMADKIARALFPSPRKTAMAPACRELIEDRYNVRKQMQAMLDAVERTLRKARGSDFPEDMASNRSEVSQQCFSTKRNQLL